MLRYYPTQRPIIGSESLPRSILRTSTTILATIELPSAAAIVSKFLKEAGKVEAIQLPPVPIDNQLASVR